MRRTVNISFQTATATPDHNAGKIWIRSLIAFNDLRVDAHAVANPKNSQRSLCETVPIQILSSNAWFIKILAHQTALFL